MKSVHTFFLSSLLITSGLLLESSAVQATDAGLGDVLIELSKSDLEEIPFEDPAFKKILAEMNLISPEIPEEDSASEKFAPKRKAEKYTPLSSRDAKRSERSEVQFKKEIRRERNRLAAKKSRDKKEDYIKELEEKLTTIRTACDKLRAENQGLKKRVEVLEKRYASTSAK